ncbi:diacylglycerol/lipid kinase family protein [Virgibacillus necropolis]|uniref:Diacylglycerol kinase n=1 Tax=Virgibacillus necropolis TaxID=163877 RepID=A0A221MHI7_9BACI|nr:YegS/Rv2252/BmrU family lipid kinase [Virgibacillus necropolis]ASN07106.1 diacylglycerol kinase [Virgibacillus necropolis]
MKYETGLFLYNSNAGNDDLEQKLEQTLPSITKAIKKLTIIQTETINEVKRICADYADHVDIIVILGGDGTIHECINSIAPLEKKPIIGVLPGGTCNDFSRMLGTSQNLKQAAEGIARGEIVDIDLGKTGERYFLNFWGIGFVSEASLNVDPDQKRSFGVLSYYMSTLRTVNQAESFSYKIKTDVETYDGEAVLILVLNGRFMGTKELPITTADPSDGKMDVLIIKTSNLASFREFLSMNKPTTDPDELSELIHFQAESLEIETDRAKEVDMDGEINGATPASITILPKYIRMVKGTEII